MIWFYWFYSLKFLLTLSAAAQPDRSALRTDTGSSARPDRVDRPVRVKKDIVDPAKKFKIQNSKFL
jgi:hypothetical protein